MSSYTDGFVLFIALGLGVVAGTLLPLWRKRQRRRRESRAFAQSVVQTWSLPKEVGWFKGGLIQTDLDAQGYSMFRYKGRRFRFPAPLSDNGIEAWNITEREAKIIVLLCWASMHHGDA